MKNRQVVDIRPALAVFVNSMINDLLKAKLPTEKAKEVCQKLFLMCAENIPKEDDIWQKYEAEFKKKYGSNEIRGFKGWAAKQWGRGRR